MDDAGTILPDEVRMLFPQIFDMIVAEGRRRGLCIYPGECFLPREARDHINPDCLKGGSARLPWNFALSEGTIKFINMRAYLMDRIQIVLRFGDIMNPDVYASAAIWDCPFVISSLATLQEMVLRPRHHSERVLPTDERKPLNIP